MADTTAGYGGPTQTNNFSAMMVELLEKRMTETRELDVITEALAIIDRGLGEMLHRELVSTDEVADLLLDVRTLLSAPREPAAN
ncbi:MAG TPA: hypothetical protein VGJ03_15205 [Acidimicrobiales bacterium]